MTNKFDPRIKSESRASHSIFLSNLHSGGAGFLVLSLVIARILFSAILLNSVVDWGDLQWAEIYSLALVPFLWALTALILWMLGKLRWKFGGRLMMAIDLVICAGVIIFFPPFMLSALSLAFLSCTLLVSRHDGRFASFSALLPLAAMLIRPLDRSLMPRLNLPVNFVNIGVGGEIIAFLLSSLVVIFSILIIVRIRLMEQPLTFQQPWEADFSVPVGKHNIQPIIERLDRLYPANKVICVLDSPKSSGGISLVTSSEFQSKDIDPVRSQLISGMDQWTDPTIFVFGDQVCINVEAGTLGETPASYNALIRGLIGLGFGDGVMLDFMMGHTHGRLFFATGTIVDEALRRDVSVLNEQLDSYFKNATKWELRRREMIALSRDLARRDLHDGVLQSLAALKMRLVTIIASPAFTGHSDVDSLRKTVDIITIEQSRLRALLHNDEDANDAINLVEALEVCLQNLSLQWEITAKLTSSEPALPVDKESAENIEYLIREAIANRVRHAGATQIAVALALNKGDLMITLKDDQIVPVRDTDSHKAAQSILQSRSLQQRLRLVNGSAYLKDMKESTLLAISIPMDFAANE